MIVALDKYGNVTLPGPVREKLGLDEESYLELTVVDDGIIMLQPVSVQRTIRLNEKGQKKIEEARESGIGEFPDWLKKDMEDAKASTEREVS